MQDEVLNSFGIIVFCHEMADLLNQEIKLLLRNDVKPIIFSKFQIIVSNFSNFLSRHHLYISQSALLMDICPLFNLHYLTIFEYHQRCRPPHNQIICPKLQAMISVLDSKRFCE